MNAEQRLKPAATALLKLRAEVARQERKLSLIKAKESALEAQILLKLQKAQLESIGTDKAILSIGKQVIVELYDDKAFFGYVRKNNAFDLVRRQPVIAACKDRWEQKVKIPGCRPGKRLFLSIYTRRGKNG